MASEAVKMESESAAALSDADVLQVKMTAMGRRGRKAARALATCRTETKNAALRAIASALRQNEGAILQANAVDLAEARKNGLTPAMIDRLDLGKGRVAAMIGAVETVASLDDPVGEVLDMHERPNGLRIGQMRSPIGVIAIIYESRPNVTADAACLCVKSGNAVILRGGSEAIRSNQAIAMIMSDAATQAGLPENSIQFVSTPDRAAVQALLKLDEYIDLIIPRGGRGLIESIVANSRVPVIKHLDGNCYIFVDDSADVDQAVKIILNAKVQRPGVCNALESLLVHEKIAPTLFEKLIPALVAEGVEIRADESVRKLSTKILAEASDEDWDTEYLDLILTAGTVASLDDAIEFINAHSSHHTDAILTGDDEHAQRFLAAVDSASVMVNASTRFADGGEYGFGCEIGISTDKLHARGPMGLRDLTTKKYVVQGTGQIRE